MVIINKKTKEKVDFKKNFKIYVNLISKYKWIFVFILFLSLVIEGSSLLEKYLFKLVIDNSTQFVAKGIEYTAFTHILFIIAAVFVITAFFKLAGNIIQLKIVNRFDAQIMFDLKKKFFDHIINLSHRFHTTHRTGSLISRMSRGSGAMESISDFITYNLTPLVLQVVIIGGSLIYFDFTSAIIIFITAFIFIVYSVFISNKQQIPQYNANYAEDRERGIMADIFTNVDSIKYFGKEDIVQNKFAELATNTKKKIIRFWDYGVYFQLGQIIIISIGTFFLIYFPIIKFLHNELSIGTLTFIYTVYLTLVGTLFGFVHGIRRFYISLGDLDALFEYAKIENDIKDVPNAKKLKIEKGAVEFRDIGFSYHDRKIINGVSLKINPGEKVALVGHSGSGKTTLVKLLYRFYDVNSGKILIDGKNINQFNQESLRSELSIVPQECILFDDTIYNNIKFSNPKASKEEVLRAIKFAQLSDFISKLPKKYNTIVGERGVKLSGGEKQRVSIARALLANKKVLVLDEATSSLDSHTEHEIQQDLEKLMKGRTSIIIAHRLSTIMKADKIVVMDKGKIVQIGKHRNLINQRGVYKELWNLQKGGYIE